MSRSVMCKAKVHDTWHSYACQRKAVRDGYCTIHHPDAEKARRAKNEQRYHERQELERRQRNERVRGIVREFLGAHREVIEGADDVLWTTVWCGVDSWEYEKPPRASSGNAGVGVGGETTDGGAS